MKRALLCSAFAALLTGCGLCPSPPSAATGTAARYPITDVATAPATPVRNQAKSGTCWAFGGVSLIESEAIRTRRCTLDLSEMWVVRHAYFEKAVKYVRTRGRVAFDQGGEIQDVLWLVDRYGIVPQSLYEGGAADGTYDHASLAKAIRRLAKRIVDKKLYEKEHWQRMIDEELDRRLGARPDRFVIDGVAYTPFSYADSIGFRRDDYIALTSFTHHPFFERFVLEIPDNWAAHATLNIPLDSLMRLLDSALAAGYTAAWDADVSERGFGRRAGIALLPQPPQHFQPVQFGHHDVQHRRVRHGILHFSQRVGRIRERAYRIAGRAQRHLQQHADALIILHHKNTRCLRHTDFPPFLTMGNLAGCRPPRISLRGRYNKELLTMKNPARCRPWLSLRGRRAGPGGMLMKKLPVRSFCR